VLDFHGQRTTFITGLARAGVAPATAQRLARHSDINLTLGTYTRLGIDDLATAVGSLPALHVGPHSLAATGDASAPPVAPHPHDPELDRLIQSWPNLSAPVRRAILALLGPETANAQD
jgi:hypothetical protein